MIGYKKNMIHVKDKKEKKEMLTSMYTHWEIIERGIIS